MKQYEIHLGLDMQSIQYDGDIKQLTKELQANDWCYFESWDGSAATVHSDYGKNVTSINEITEPPPEPPVNEA